MPDPAVSVVVPTRNRAGYLSVTLASLAGQAPGLPFEVIVVDDGSDGDDTRTVAAAAGAAGARPADESGAPPGAAGARPADESGAPPGAAGARPAAAASHGDGPAGPGEGAAAGRARVAYVRHGAPRGPNAARNTGIEAARAPLIALIDDDVRVPPGWVGALAAGADRHAWAAALGGPIRASLEGPAPAGCGRESAPITTLDLGPHDREADFVWSANMAVRRAAIERFGGFDEHVPIYGDEEEWLLRLHAGGGRVAYVADAWLEHRRCGDDARLRSLARAEYRRGRAARRNDRRKGSELTIARELRNLAGAGWHTARRRCPQGLIMGAHSTGRILEALRRR